MAQLTGFPPKVLKYSIPVFLKLSATSSVVTTAETYLDIIKLKATYKFPEIFSHYFSLYFEMTESQVKFGIYVKMTNCRPALICAWYWYIGDFFTL